MVDGGPAAEVLPILIYPVDAHVIALNSNFPSKQPNLEVLLLELVPVQPD